MKGERKKEKEAAKSREDAQRKVDEQMQQAKKDNVEKGKDIGRLKKEMQDVKRELGMTKNNLAHKIKELDEEKAKEKPAAESGDSGGSGGGGLMDVSGMAEMQAAIAAELKSKYEEKIRTLQAKIVQSEKKRTQDEKARRLQNTEDIKKAMVAAQKAAERKIAKKEEQLNKKNEKLLE